MNSGMLKQIFIEHDVRGISVISSRIKNGKPYTVVNAEFDAHTRKRVFLFITQNPPPRTNRTPEIKSYIADFKDSHTVSVKNLDKNEQIEKLSSDYTIEDGKLQLSI